MCRLAAIRKDDRYSFRLKTLIDNVVDKWRQGWVVKVMRGTEAKTLGEIHKEAALDNAQEQAGNYYYLTWMLSDKSISNFEF